MEKKISQILNIGFIVVFVLSIGWFAWTSYKINKIEKERVVNVSTRGTDSTYVLDVNNDGMVDTVTLAAHKVKAVEEKKIGWEAILTTIISGLGGIIKFVYDYIKKKKDEARSEYNNTNHPVFSVINELLITEVKNLELGSVGRTLVFKIMLTEQIRAFEVEIRKFVNQQFTGSADFREKSRMLIFTALETSEERWKQQNVPELLIERYKLLQQVRVKLLMSDVETIAFYRLSDETKNYAECTFYLLTHVSVLLRLGLTEDTVKTLKELNGEVKKLTFNGMQLI